MSEKYYGVSIDEMCIPSEDKKTVLFIYEYYTQDEIQQMQTNALANSILNNMDIDDDCNTIN